MTLVNNGMLMLLLLMTILSAQSFGSMTNVLDVVPIRSVANITYATENLNANGLASIFSPRMDFEQWKPLTGRGDPLRNDPTYDYEPPVLERVHYWADDVKPKQQPEKKNEVLMLGVSSRKPSVTSRQPPPPPPPPARRQQQRPTHPKYEDFTYKLSDHYPMTILVPPPPPPPGHQPQIFTLGNEKLGDSSHIKLTIPPSLFVQNTTQPLDSLTTEYALQEANLIYQSSTTNQRWIVNANHTKTTQNNVVSSDYAGWGPTTPLEDVNVGNETRNFVSNDIIKLSNIPYSPTFYKPMLSESPPPPPPSVTTKPLLWSTFLPTVLPPPRIAEQPSVTFTQVTWPTETSTHDISTDVIENQEHHIETTTATQTLITQPTAPSYEKNPNSKPDMSIFDMLGPMMSMPLGNGPERPEDNLYAHASVHKHVIHKQKVVDDITLATMQTMQPPPPQGKLPETTAAPKDISQVFTFDPYLHMRYTTPSPTTSSIKNPEQAKLNPELHSAPMYLIIQGHSKVKTYSSKLKSSDKDHTISNEIPKPNETNEVKHLHPIKEKSSKKSLNTDKNRTSRFQNLKSLVDKGLGSIEIQETDVGIQYDVSDGSEVPIEVYKKGIVDSDENNNYVSKDVRPKRQIDLEDIIPFDTHAIKDYIYNFFKGKQNETSLTGLITQVMTSDDSDVIDDLSDDNDNSDQEDEER